MLVILAIIVVGIGYLVFQSQKEVEQPMGTQVFTLDARNCTYIVDGKKIRLTNGYSEEKITPASDFNFS